MSEHFRLDEPLVDLTREGGEKLQLNTRHYRVIFRDFALAMVYESFNNLKAGILGIILLIIGVSMFSITPSYYYGYHSGFYNLYIALTVLGLILAIWGLRKKAVLTVESKGGALVSLRIEPRRMGEIREIFTAIPGE